MSVLGHFSYWVTIFLLIAGLYIVIARGNLIKKLIGLSIFQTSVYLLYIAPGKLIGATAPIVAKGYESYSNPLPHVLILTAIVVGVATLALGLALVVRIREAYGSIEEDEILERIGIEATRQRAAAIGRTREELGVRPMALEPPQFPPGFEVQRAKCIVTGTHQRGSAVGQ